MDISPSDSARPHTLFILPEIESRRTEPITILVLADGNRRCSSSGGGYAGGAHRVVAIAEHLARRPDVAVMIACILSPDNIAKRSDGFFFALYKEFIQLGVDIETRGALVAASVRMEVHGDLDALRARGGHAVSLADAIVAVARATEGVETPDLRLVLGVGYGRDVARELGVDLVLRTGMEEPGVLRLSGLRTSERIATAAITTLWPDVEPREVDEVIDLCKRRASLRFATGHGASVILHLVEALSRAESDAPVRATIPTSAPAPAIATALERLFAGPLRGCATIAVEHARGGGHVPERHGPEEARHVLRIVGGAPPETGIEEGEILTVLAPGQRPPLFTLPDWLPLGHANVFACEPTAHGMLEAVRTAQRFSAAHPPLLGRDRVIERVPRQRSPETAEASPGACERDALADRFTEKTLAWASAAGLLPPDAASRTAAVNYALTAFFTHFRIPTEWDEDGARWEERADLIARYMLLVAAGDEGIFDRVFEGETPERRWTRLELSSCFLQGALRSEGSRARLPDVPGAALMATISEQWRVLFERYHRSCHPAAAASFRAGLESLYVASLAEHRAGIASRLLDERASTAAIERRFAATPPAVAARARTIVAGAVEGSVSAANELRALLYLGEVGGAIGAGLLFRTAALAAPASSVTGRSLALLDSAATLLDYHVRLSNDASGFLDSPAGDRDPKENACTVLVPASASGVGRQAAIVRALATCQRLATWLGGEVSGAICRVAEAWPSMGVILRRGAFVGRRVYEVGHYTTVSREGMSRIFDEADEVLGGPR